MCPLRTGPFRTGALASLSLLALLAAPAGAQGQSGEPTLYFTIDWQGPSQGTLGTGTGLKVTEADLLRPAGGAPDFDAVFPFQALTGADLGLPLYSLCDPAPGDRCSIEVDAVSMGTDRRLRSTQPFVFAVYFSTDEYAQGSPTVGPVNVLRDEAPSGDISADVFTRPFAGAGPFPPPLTPRPISNVGLVDGNGLASSAGVLYRGLGLREPNVPFNGLPGQPFDTGDNVDGFDLDAPRNPTRVYFSLDAGFLDPVIGIPNSGSAQANFGAGGGDVLTRGLLGGQVQVYAAAPQLGLDPLLDDLDALVLAENGVPGYQPSLIPYDWETGATDMLLFSVRRGSAIVGQIDSLLGLPIEPGDLLTAPLGGPDGSRPGIMIAAENLGLETARSNGVLVGAELDGADLDGEPPYHDCNGNEVEDAVDIATGASCDDNGNGIPDECESPGGPACDCAAGAPCGNAAPGTGCLNSTGGGGLLSGSGSSSVFSDDLVLSSSGLPAFQFGLSYMGPALIQVPFGDGLRCIGPGGVGIFRYPVQSSGASGTLTLGPGIVGLSCSGVFGTSGCILVGSTWNFQTWYRDPAGPCGNAFNLTNAWTLTFTP